MTQVKSTKQNKGKEKKFKLKMPSALAIIIGVVMFVTILTWIPHGAGMAYGYEDGIADGSMAAWQNYIFFNTLGLDATTGHTLAEVSSKVDEWAINSNIDFASLGITEASDKVDFFIGTMGLNGSFTGADTVAGFFETDLGLPFLIGGYSDGHASMFGIFDTFKAMLAGYGQAFGVAFYLVGIFAVVLLLMETNTLKDGVSSLVKGLGGREILLVPILFILFALGGTLFGMQEETLGLLPIIVPVLILAGFDATTGMLVAVLGTTTGIAASVLDPFSVGVMAEGLGAKISDALLERLILFIVYVTVGSIFITAYASRVKKNNDKSIDKDNLESNKLWAKESIGDIHELETMSKAQKTSMIVFTIMFSWMILSLLPWTTWFAGLGDNEGWQVFSHLFFGNVLFGEWYFIETGILFFVGAFIIGKTFKMSNSKILNAFWSSLKEMFGVITIISFSRATAMILSSTGLTYGMIYGTLGSGTDNLGAHPVSFALIWLLIFTMMALFIPSTSGLAGITAPLAGATINSADPEKQQIMIIGVLMAYPLAQGVINMFSPTTGLVVVQAEQSKVNFGKVLPLLASYAATIFVIGVLMITLILTIETKI